MHILLGGLRDGLNGMEELMTGNPVFQDEDLIQGLLGCFQKFDPEIEAAQDAQWQGFLDYGVRGGNPPDDTWEPCPDTVIMT